jgi:hypothetical protein
VYVLFLIVPPLVLGVLMGWHRAGVGALLPRNGSILLWSLNWLVFWWVAEALVAAMKRVLKPWTSSVAAAVGASAALNVVLASLYTPWLMASVASLQGVEMPYGPGAMSRDLFDPAYLLVLVQASGPGLVIWCGLRLLVSQAATRPEPVITDAQAAATTVVSPADPARARLAALLARKGERSLDAVLALVAQDHYVEVVLPARRVLVHVRFRDAIAAFEANEGILLSRSAWVRQTAIARLEGPKQEFALLTNGDRLPIVRDRRPLLASLVLNS